YLVYRPEALERPAVRAFREFILSEAARPEARIPRPSPLDSTPGRPAESAGRSRGVALLPLDAAANARFLCCRHRASREHGLDSGAQVGAGHGHVVRRAAVVVLAPVHQPAPGVE